MEWMRLVALRFPLCLATPSDSKLTRLTSEALGGVCKTSFIATVTPSITDLGETLSTLRYAKNAMEALNISQVCVIPCVHVGRDLLPGWLRRCLSSVLGSVSNPMSA